MSDEQVITRSDTSFTGWAFMRHHWTKLNGNYLINRWQIFQCPWFAVFVTGLTPDTRPDPHDHDRTIITWKIRGGYTERIYTDPADLSKNRLRMHKRWSWSVIPMWMAHEIISTLPGTWTFTFNGPYRGDHRAHWTKDGKIHWREYDAYLNSLPVPRTFAADICGPGTGSRSTS
jgi:hypothetical protein